MNLPTSHSSATQHRVVFGLGSNLGERLDFLRNAAELLERDAQLAQPARSRVYATAALGPPQPDYLNAAIAGWTELPLDALLRVALAVEAQLGRVRDKQLRWGPRVIDVDVLWSDSLRSASAGLTVPHPGLTTRAFALQPLLDVVPEARSPAGERYADFDCASAPITLQGTL